MSAYCNVKEEVSSSRGRRESCTERKISFLPPWHSGFSLEIQVQEEAGLLIGSAETGGLGTWLVSCVVTGAHRTEGISALSVKAGLGHRGQVKGNAAWRRLRRGSWSGLPLG